MDFLETRLFAPQGNGGIDPHGPPCWHDACHQAHGRKEETRTQEGEWIPWTRPVKQAACIPRKEPGPAVSDQQSHQHELESLAKNHAQHPRSGHTQSHADPNLTGLAQSTLAPKRASSITPSTNPIPRGLLQNSLAFSISRLTGSRRERDRIHCHQFRKSGIELPQLVSNTSRTRWVSASMVNGFCSSCTPSSSTPSCATTSAVYPDM
jgi:hypothetical protein